MFGLDSCIIIVSSRFMYSKWSVHSYIIIKCSVNSCVIDLFSVPSTSDQYNKCSVDSRAQ